MRWAWYLKINNTFFISFIIVTVSKQIGDFGGREGRFAQRLARVPDADRAGIGRQGEGRAVAESIARAAKQRRRLGACARRPALVTGQVSAPAGDAGTAADIAGANGTGTERALTVEAKGIERGAMTRASRAKAHGGFFSPLRRDALVDLRARHFGRPRPFEQCGWQVCAVAVFNLAPCRTMKHSAFSPHQS